MLQAADALHRNPLDGRRPRIQVQGLPMVEETKDEVEPIYDLGKIKLNR